MWLPSSTPKNFHHQRQAYYQDDQAEGYQCKQSIFPNSPELPQLLDTDNKDDGFMDIDSVSENCSVDESGTYGL